MHEHAQQAPSIRLPDTAQGCRDRLAALQDEIASIRIQIATTDIRRQVEKKSLDPTWYHRAKTALRLKQQEMALVSARLGQLGIGIGSGAGRRDRFKDALIEVLRAECDDERWASAVSRARELQARQESSHG
jgi:hypothetical protein